MALDFVRTKPASSIVPLTRTIGFGPLPEMLVEWESERALHNAFQSEGLSLAILDDPKLYVPLPAMMAVFQRAARSVGRRDFGLRVGERMQQDGFGLWVQYSMQAPTLREGIERAGKTVRFHQSGAKFGLHREGQYAVWRYWHPCQGHGVHHTDHVIYPMLASVRYFLGADWTPAWFEVDYRRDADAHIIEQALPAPVRYGRPAMGMAIPIEYLVREGPPRNSSRRITLIDVKAEDIRENCDEPLRSILAIATLRLMDGRTDIDGAAQMAGISVRTLQRVLSRDGLNYRGLVEQVRLNRAQALLKDTDLTITQVALTLGYSEHANFTRAFSRWTGLSPLHFRRRSH
ncbi:AraC family transcriptional regulator [Methyloceanibacter sp.]|uniref:AraC family transcriptional regulator n=1 Tax=Methyloceanibacter sp. TaxID=1965321 RepID=UPI00208087F7|nr:AraC family transcriptional regulator [Methyloceanibacter sp.]GFO81586.1 MAG: transcriptional regulator [Methyloceanibacter sp.]HML92856.1 AraC family transcriptional regulator ligand-binding domain-containing protein [Methyloceanibacter sp.]